MTASDAADPAPRRKLRWEYLVIIAVFIILGPFMLYFVLHDGAGNADVTIADADADITATLEIAGMHFHPDSIEVTAGEEVVLKIVNDDDVAHDLKIGDRMSGNIRPGETVLFDAGSFQEDTEGWCTVSGHKRQGMTFMVYVN